MFAAFISGIFLSIGLIIPLGVQNIFIFNQGATQRRLIQALPSVITASVCDSILIIIAISGVSLLALTIPWLRTTFLMLSFAFLSYMGWVTWHHCASQLRQDVQPLSITRQCIFTMTISILNPHALIDTIGVIGTGSLQFESTAKIAYTVACIAVSCTWFFGLSLLGRFINKQDNAGTWMMFVNKLSAVIMWIVAVSIFWQVLEQSVLN